MAGSRMLMDMKRIISKYLRDNFWISTNILLNNSRRKKKDKNEKS
jgi:hypothetical protein